MVRWAIRANNTESSSMHVSGRGGGLPRLVKVVRSQGKSKQKPLCATTTRMSSGWVFCERSQSWRTGPSSLLEKEGVKGGGGERGWW